VISLIRGHVVEILEESCTVDVHGVGYEIFGSSFLLESLKLNQERTFFIHTVVREDAFQLFGFQDRKEKMIFLSLLKVDRVGPKMAMKLMSGAPAGKIAEAIDSGDVGTLSAMPRVGKKLAEQIIFKLKGKIPMDSLGKEAVTGDREKIMYALVNLGFKSNDVEKVIEQLPSNVTLEEGVRQGLAALAQR
jgi:Holliday junction DNA helicase RuvA